MSSEKLRYNAAVPLEKRIRILAWIHTLLGGIPFCFGLILVVSVFADSTSTAYTRGMVAGLFFWIGVVLLLPSFVGGLGLLFRKRWGRVVVILVSIELLLAFPVGTALGAFGLWALLSRDSVPVIDSWRPVAAGSKQRASGILLVMLGVGGAFVLVLGVGLKFLDLKRMGVGVGVAMALVLVALAVGFSVALLRSCGYLKGDLLPTTGWGGSRTILRATPLPGTPPALPVQGACLHLQPIEQAMVAAGVAMKNNVAQCRIHEPSLQRQFGSLATYREYFQPERYIEDNPTARLDCRHCTGGIYTLHPQECSLATPWFPEGPEPLVLRSEQKSAKPLPVTAMAASGSGGLLAVASGRHEAPAEVTLWDIADVRPVRRFATEGVTRALAWSCDERTLFAGRGVLWSDGPGSAGASIFVIDAGSGQELLRFGDGLFGVRGMALSPDGRTLLVSAMLGRTAAEGSALDLLDVASGRLISRLATLDASVPGWVPQFNGVAFTPDGAFAIAACSTKVSQVPASQWQNRQLPWWWSRGVRIWQVADGHEVNLIPLPPPVTTVAVSNDGLRLFAAGDRLSVWNLADGTALWNMANFADHAVAFSADGRLVARGTGWKEDNHGPYRECAVELYDGMTGQFLTRGEHRTTPSAVAFLSPAGLAAGEIEGQIRFWNRE